VRRIFAAADLDTKDIAATLNATGLARRNGKSWTVRQVAAILARRPLYYDGMIRYGEASGRIRSSRYSERTEIALKKEGKWSQKLKTAPLCKEAPAPFYHRRVRCARKRRR